VTTALASVGMLIAINDGNCFERLRLVSVLFIYQESTAAALSVKKPGITRFFSSPISGVDAFHTFFRIPSAFNIDMLVNTVQ